MKIYDLVCERLGFKHIWENQGIVGSSKLVSEKIGKNMEHVFRFQWANYIKNNDGRKSGMGNKLEMYSTIKTNFDYEKYLDFQQDFRVRRDITKLRISAHRLEIEAGRYKTPKIPTDKRFCKQCGVVEDEYHLIMKCQKYTNERKLLLQKIENIIFDYSKFTDPEIFKIILSCNEYDMFPCDFHI